MNNIGDYIFLISFSLLWICPGMVLILHVYDVFAHTHLLKTLATPFNSLVWTSVLSGAGIVLSIQGMLKMNSALSESKRTQQTTGENQVAYYNSLLNIGDMSEEDKEAIIKRKMSVEKLTNTNK